MIVQIDSDLLVRLIALARSGVSEMWYSPAIEEAEKDIEAAKRALEKEESP